MICFYVVFFYILISFLFFIADYVYFENSSSNPYLIRRIEELNKVRKYLRLLINLWQQSAHFSKTENDFNPMRIYLGRIFWCGIFILVFEICSVFCVCFSY